MSFDVVIVTYNSSHYLERLASSIKRSGVTGSIVIVDNASKDGSIEVAGKLDWGSPLQLIKNDRNIGFGAAMNIGVRASETKSEFVLLVNPDVELESDTVANLLTAMADDESLACAGPRLETSDGYPVSSARALPTLWSLATRRVTEQVPSDGQVMYVGWVCGAVMLWRRDSYQRLGGFSPEYFLYYEDVDICRKAWDAGLKVATVDKAKAIHDQGHGERPSLILQKHSRNSRRLYVEKWLGPWGRVSTLAAELTETVARVRRLKVGQSK